MDYDVTMEEVVKGVDVTFVAGSQPAGNEGRSLLHASIVSRCGVDGPSKGTGASAVGPTGHKAVSPERFCSHPRRVCR